MKGMSTSSGMRRGVLLFITVSVVIFTGILIVTADRGTWQGLLNFRLVYIPVLLALTAVRWLFDGQAFVVLCRYGPGKQLSLARGAAIRLEGTLVSGVVPIVIGAFTTHTYLLYKEGLRISESVAVSVLRSMLPVFMFLVNIPILLAMNQEAVPGTLFRQILTAISIPIVGAILFFVIAILCPQIVHAAGRFLLNIFVRIKLVRRQKKNIYLHAMSAELKRFRQVLRLYIIKRKKALFAAVFWIFAAFLVDYICGLCIVAGFGYHVPVTRGIALQFLMKPIIYFAPSPGGAGIWELTYLGFFSLYLPKYLLGVAVLMWRLITSYIPLTAGFTLFVRDFKSRKEVSALIRSRTEFARSDD